jgi:hypothetical protein
MVELTISGTALASPPATPEAERLEWSRTLRLRALLRERCRRLAAPEALRQRILASLPHRSQAGLD